MPFAVQADAANLGLLETETTVYPTSGDLTISFNIYQEIFINQEMCTRNCPCAESDKMSQWRILDSAERAGYQRNKEFVFTANPFVIKYDTYDACIEGVQDPSVPENLAAGHTATQAFYQFAKNFREQGDFTEIKEWIEFFEDEYECAGICEVALFNWIQPVAEGIPTKSCVTSVKEDLEASFMGLGISTLVTGGLLFLIWLCQYCMWRKY